MSGWDDIALSFPLHSHKLFTNFINSNQNMDQVIKRISEDKTYHSSYLDTWTVEIVNKTSCEMFRLIRIRVNILLNHKSGQFFYMIGVLFPHIVRKMRICSNIIHVDIHSPIDSVLLIKFIRTFIWFKNPE